MQNTLQQTFDSDWLKQVTANLSHTDTQMVKSAVEHVAKHIDVNITSLGEPLINHAKQVALILTRLEADAPTRASAILVALIADSETIVDKNRFKTIIDAMREHFSPEIITLVQGTHSLLRIGFMASKANLDTNNPDNYENQTEKQRKMLLAMAADLRIVLIRLASRLQSLTWFAASKTPCPVELAKETLELYTPLANRLGIWQIKWEMEDLAFRFLHPTTYKEIATQLEEKRTERETFIEEIIQTIKSQLLKSNIDAKVSGRPKHIYSIWNKMRNKNLRFDQLWDLRALRVIVKDERECYVTLALVHSLWTPVPQEFDDYISRPKPNGYRSLHTVVTDEKGRHFEVQIRTMDMHQAAEYGMAAHWRYKEAGPKGGTESASGSYDQKIAWMRQLLSESDKPTPESNDGDVLDTQGNKSNEKEKANKSTKSQSKDKSSDRIYVMTPQARVIELPAGATPVDFAYYLHTDLGHRCRGAKVDGKMVPLLTKLQTGQTVEIVATKSGGPSRDWLNPQLGFLASPRSRAKVRSWFNAIELQERISQGQTLVEKELQRLGKTAINLEGLSHKLGFAHSDDLYVAVAKEEFSLRQIDNILKNGETAEATAEKPVYTSGRDSVDKTGKSGVLVVGVDSLLTQLARCCRPAPPDQISGFVTRGRGVSIHKSNCASYLALATKHPERLIEVAWGDTGNSLYPVDINVYASESPSLLRDLSEVFAKLRINVVGINTQSRKSLTHLVCTVEVRNGEQIQQLLNALNELSSVSASRA